MRVIAGLVTGLLVVTAPSVAMGDWEGGAAGGIPDNTPVTYVYDSAGGEMARHVPRGRGGGRTRPRRICHFYAVETDEFGAVASFLKDLGPVTPSAGDLVGLECVNPATDVITYQELLVFDPGNPLGRIAAGERAAEEALAALPLPEPTIHTSPPASAFQLVGFPTWYWTDSAIPLSATASIATIASTVTATPTELVIDTGDDHSITCTAPRPNTDDCTYTYAWSSRHRPSGRYDLTATQTWHVTWAATNGETGDLGDITQTATIPLLVQEAQAVTN